MKVAKLKQHQSREVIIVTTLIKLIVAFVAKQETAGKI